VSGASAVARTTIVLFAGGAATRLPGKLSLPVWGEPMLARVYRRVVDGRRPCVVSARVPLGLELAAAIRAPVVLDGRGDAGPLGALVTVAATLATPLLFAAAGDLPELDAAFVDDLEAEYDRVAAESDAPEAVVPRWPDGRIEPLAALYDVRAAVSAGEAALDGGRRRMSAMLDGLRVRHFAVRPQDEARLVNVNTPPDYDAYHP
jgi:molybdenum cofactor guanylyltransferase